MIPWLQRIHEKRPLVTCLTNMVTVNDVANSILAVGGSPVMSREKGELRELIGQSSALVLNIGTLQVTEIDTFQTAMEEAAAAAIPVILDPVGAGATAFRTQVTLRLLNTAPCAVLRGNASEMRALWNGAGQTSGVDAAKNELVTEQNAEKSVRIFQQIAEKYSCIVSVSGPVDVICSATEHRLCLNGTPRLAFLTGTGCSLTGITGAFLGAAQPDEYLDATATAVALMGCAGELAEKETSGKGLGSFHTALLDALSLMTDEQLARMAIWR